jgi:hypothetical protein
MDLTAINSAIDAAYADALVNGGQMTLPQTIAQNVTLRIDSYVAPGGSGFRVVACVVVPEANYTAVRVKNHGPDTDSEREWPSEGIEAAAQAHVARCIEAGADFVNRSGFDADRKVILLNKLLKAKQDGTVADFPKLTALYVWMETVQAMAVSGQTFFPKAPHTFEEVIKE